MDTVDSDGGISDAFRWIVQKKPIRVRTPFMLNY